MIIFLYGPDDYRREQKKKEIVADFSKKHSKLGVAAFDLSNAEEFPRLQEFLRSQSIFEPFKLAILEQSFENQILELAAELKKFLENPSTVLLLSERETPAKALKFLTAKPVVTQQFEYLKGVQLEKFISAQAQTLGLRLSAEALRFFANAYQNDTWRLVTELGKASSLGKQALTRDDCEALNIEIAPGFWELFNGLKSRDLGERLTTLQKVFALHEPGAKVFNILSSQWREKLPEFAEADLAVKSGKLDYEEALLRIVLA